APNVAAVYAVDVTDSLFGTGVRPPNFFFVPSDWVPISLPPESIDIAYSNQLLEHVHPEDAEDHVRPVFQTLQPRGKYICITPNRLSGPWDISRQFTDTARGLHLREYTVSELVDLLRS